MELPKGIPSHDTFGDVFSRLDPEQFQSCLWGGPRRWPDWPKLKWWPLTVRRCAAPTTGPRGQQAIHLVSAWASANSMTLGQVKVERKSNEITAIPKLLGLLALHGCIVTIDAMGCQREIAEQIVEAGADYVLAVKENQGQLDDDVRDLFQGAVEFGFEGVPHDYARTLNKGHGRLETRECWAVTDPECSDYLQTKQQWAGIKAVVKISARRETASGATVQPRYYISSLDAPAGTMLESVRRHWSIENSLHWTLDVTYREDQCRVRKDHAPQNLATLRQIPHNLLKNETSLKVGIQGKRLNAGWRQDYLLKVLLG